MLEVRQTVTVAGLKLIKNKCLFIIIFINKIIKILNEKFQKLGQCVNGIIVFFISTSLGRIVSKYNIGHLF